MANPSFKRAVLAGLVAFLAGAIPAALAARAPAGFRVETREAEATADLVTGICAKVVCLKPRVCQPSEDGKTYACVFPPPEGLCGEIVCPRGTRCCNPLRSICTRPGVVCPLDGGPATTTKKDVSSATEEVEGRDVASREAAADESENKGTPCGPNFCNKDQECCNASCGICVKPGGGCTKQFCLPPLQGPQCGIKTRCPTGYVCCNSSCGICTLPGGKCTQQFCDPPV